MWWLSGIFRDVYLLAVPPCHIYDFTIQTELDSQYKDSVLTFSALLKNNDQQSQKCRIDLQLMDGNRCKIEELHKSVVQDVANQQNTNCPFYTQLGSILHLYLYDLWKW